MPRSTPRTAGIQDDFEDFSLGADSFRPPVRDAASYTATDAVTGVLVYTHGCSVRITLKMLVTGALEALSRCGWSEDADPLTWKASRPGARLRRWVVRGSKWLDERPPSNGRLPLVNMNREWRTRIYSLAVERKGDTFHVDLQVIRYGDVRKFMEEILGLQNAEYEIAYYRTVERYIVVQPHVALRLAEGIGALPAVGKGRQGRKRWLVKDHEIPITIRTSARTKASLVVYRIDRGATAHYKIEVRLRGKRQNRGQFHAADAARLDAVLLDLVKTYGLTTKPSPARWEPRTFTTPVERGPFDPCIKQLPQRAWRGTKVSDGLKRTVQGCHTPSLVRCVIGARENGSFPLRPRIRSESHPSGSSPTYSDTGEWRRIEGNGFETTHYIYEDEPGEQHEDHLPARRPRDPYRRTAEDIARSGLYLHEVILDPEESPRRLLHALASGPLGNVGVAALCAVDSAGHADTWQSVIEAANEYPFQDEDLDTLVLVIDPNAVFDVVGAIVGGVEPHLVDGDLVGNLDYLFVDGPLVPPVSGMDVTHRAMAGWLADLLDGLRHVGEETGVRVVLVTCDARPEHGYGYMRRSHFFRDGRVRSSIGDAGRCYAHQRYRIERAVKTTYFRAHTEVSENENGETMISEYHAHEEHEYVTGNVVVLKDEVEGLPGRLVYER